MLFVITSSFLLNKKIKSFLEIKPPHQLTFITPFITPFLFIVSVAHNLWSHDPGPETSGPIVCPYPLPGPPARAINLGLTIATTVGIRTMPPSMLMNIHMASKSPISA